jgi:hydrogenase/urease accessory protein HupE
MNGAIARALRAGLLLALVLVVTPASADEFKPAYLQLTQVDKATWDVLWKLPALDENTPLKLSPVFAPDITTVGEKHRNFANGAVVQRWRIRAEGGLAGRAIEFPNLPDQRIEVLVRLVRLDGTVQLARPQAAQPRFVPTDSPGNFEVARTYTLLGIHHILSGVDHLLFVLSLMLLTGSTRRLIWTVTAFTLAHSITLALATLGVIHVPGPPVEALIALSIVFVAAEVIQARRGHAGLSKRYPWIIAFCFGLLHGLGFAGALAEVGLPPRSIPTALLFFNVGVEIGQLMFIAFVLAVVAAGRWLQARLRLPMPRWLWQVPPYAIGGLASYWVFERLAAF